MTYRLTSESRLDLSYLIEPVAIHLLVAIGRNFFVVPREDYKDLLTVEVVQH